MIEQATGLVIRTVDFSETSKVVTLFTREQGKIAAMAKGARRLKSGFESALDLLSVCRIAFLRKPRAELDLLTETLLMERFDGLRLRLDALYGGYFVAELLDGLVQAHDPHPLLFDYAIETLRDLGEGNPKQRLGRFLVVLLKEIGYEPNLDACVLCGNAIPLSGRMSVSIEAGGLVCRECVVGRSRVVHVQGGSVQTLKLYLDGDKRSVEHVKLSTRTEEEIWSLLIAWICHVMGRKPRTLTMLDAALQ